MSQTETSFAGGEVAAELVVTGMTCGSCAARIERRLNRLDGVAATVNYATGRAYFTSPRRPRRDGADRRDQLHRVPGGAACPAAGSRVGPAIPQVRDLGRRLAVCVPLAMAVIALSMVPAFQFTGWQWVSLVLTAPVAVWGAWPLHRAALAGSATARPPWTRWSASRSPRRSAGRCTRCCFGGAGSGRDADAVRVHLLRRPAGMTLYFEAAAGVTTAVLAGRYLEARARDQLGIRADRAGRARRQERRRAARRDRAAGPGRRAGRGRAVRGPPGREDRRRRGRGRGQLGGGRLAGHRRVHARRGRRRATR